MSAPAAPSLADSVFVELRFWLLILVSLVLPAALYGGMALKRSIGKATVLLIGVFMVAISGLDVSLLGRLQELARHTPSLVDDLLFNSEISAALYAVPILFGGVGVNMVSHLLIEHLREAERAHRRPRRRPALRRRVKR